MTDRIQNPAALNTSLLPTEREIYLNCCHLLLLFDIYLVNKIWINLLAVPVIPLKFNFDINISWFTQSNAFCKSQNRPPTHNLLLSDESVLFVGKYSFVNRTIKSWSQLPASLLASFPCQLNTFRKRVKNVVTSKGIECKEVKWCEV